MLENLRGMVVFASVVNHGSFSGAAKELGITTSAVSQQIRGLEGTLGVILLHRSTRKLSLTEAGEAFYESAKEVVAAAERGRNKVSQFRDELSGMLRLAVSSDLGESHVLPALTSWIQSHDDLDITILADNNNVDMIDDRIDVAVRIAKKVSDTNLSAVHLIDIQQVLVASPDYLKTHGPIETPKDLKRQALIGFKTISEDQEFEFITPEGKKQKVKVEARFGTNNDKMAIGFAKRGLGILRLSDLNARELIKSGELVRLLPEYQLPALKLYAVSIDRVEQPAKITHCIEALKKHFQSVSV